jgi:DNA invertase Pin-like site-specific DNA recombinase
MVVGVDQYKRIRKMAAEDELSQREIARRLGISRNTVARYCTEEHMSWESYHSSSFTSFCPCSSSS